MRTFTLNDKQVEQYSTWQEEHRKTCRGLSNKALLAAYRRYRCHGVSFAESIVLNRLSHPVLICLHVLCTDVHPSNVGKFHHAKRPRGSNNQSLLGLGIKLLAQLLAQAV